MHPPDAEVAVGTVNVYTSSDGRRLGQKSSRRTVTVNPAEWIFSNTTRTTDSSSPLQAGASSTEEAQAASLLDALPFGEAEAPQEIFLEPEGNSTKKRVRLDLRAAVLITYSLWSWQADTEHHTCHDSQAQARNWLPFRNDFLDELLQYEGCDENLKGADSLCHICNTEPAGVRCRDCHRRPICCQGCLVHAHADLPLHRPESWDGKRFVRTTLRDLGLVVQLGHSRGKCTHPAKNTRQVAVVDMCGIQAVNVRYCECLDAENGLTHQWRQLFHVGWFPATTHRPETAVTFQLLKTFHELNLQGKTNLYDFSKTLERLTDNSGLQEVPLSHVIRLWRHLVALKRFGRAHDTTHASGTAEGELALECPACPHPGKNIPDNWKEAPVSVRWLYTLFLMMDANFRARCKDRGFEDIQLAPGWAYFVEESKYQAHLRSRSGDKQEENTCSVEHNAIVKASIRREGYIASGVGAVLCARHALVRKNGTGDLQLGEKLVFVLTSSNMDYLLFSTLVGVLQALMISYDIVCQWCRHLWERMMNLPPEMHIDRGKVPDVRFGIPKEHIRVHGPGHSKFSFNFLPRVGRTYGEGIESQWSFMNPLSLSTREMTLGLRHELMNDHWGSWNWSKVMAFGPSLLRSLEEAHAMRVEQGRVFRDYSATFNAEVVQTWENMIAEWNKDQSRPDPYEEPKSTAAKHEIALEEAEELASGTLPPHEVTPGAFLQVGLELEDQQRALRLRGPNGSSLNALAEQQEKRNVIRRRIELWQGIQDVHMPMVAPLRAEGPDTASDVSASASRARKSPEDIVLFLPSSLPPSHRSAAVLSSLLNKERRLRLGQLSDTLTDIRHLRRILASISDYTRLNVNGEGQRAITRFRDLYASFQAKVKRATERYRAAYTAMQILEPDGLWSRTYRPLLDTDLRGPRREDESTSEGRYEVSWIWLAPTASAEEVRDFATPASAEEFAASMRVEWARAKARAERWEEEELLLMEEMRRIIKYCEWKASWWRSRAELRSQTASSSVLQGLRAYAAKQVAVWEGLACRCASWWIQYLRTLGPLPEWIAPYARHARKVRLRDFSKRGTFQAMAMREEDVSDDLDSDEDGGGGQAVEEDQDED
ncbi:hypothetical protein C2E23DRAFT_733773 [Lenzites betulinus]|nr:hypothetical protein C2E23DRAFT_733773 [Lenzites betulinus]